MKNILLSSLFALITTLGFSQVPNYVPANGLVGWWPFNGNANDESGNGNNGTLKTKHICLVFMLSLQKNYLSNTNDYEKQIT